MRAYIDVTGKNEEEAVQSALKQLGLERDDVSVEILERAKAGFLGFGGNPAKVRVSYGPEEDEAEPAPVSAPQPEKAPAQVPEKKRPQDRRREKQEKKPAAQQTEPKETAAVTPSEQGKPVVEAKDLGEEIDDEKAQAIKRFLSGLLEQLDISAEIKVYQPEKGRYRVNLVGDNLGSIIGRRGETLDAIQQLTSYSVNRTGGRVRVQLDAEGYRDKREQSLHRLAKKVAVKVVKYRRSVTLEPMNAYERHVIHTALQDEPGVTTYSTGVDPNRRVIVAYDRDKQ